MINYNELTNYFRTDINHSIYVSQPKLYSALLLYKLLLGVQYNGISLWEYRRIEIVSTSIENALVIGGMPMEESCYNEYISAFINANINETFKVAVYIDENKMVTQITTEDEENNLRPSRIFNGAVQQIVLAIIEKILPWHIHNTDEIRKKVPPLYAKNDEAAINAMLEDEIEKSGIIDKIFNDKLSKLNDEMFSERLGNIDTVITRCQARIRDLLREISSVTNELRENETLRVAVQSQKSNSEKPLDEVVEFVKSCSDIEFDEVIVSDKRINFLIKTVICQTNMEDYDILVTENNGIASFYSSFPNTIDEVKACMNAIFIDQIAKPHAVVNIGMNFENGRFFRVRIDQRDYPKNNMSNPHINHYECFGSAVAPIQEYMTKMRYSDALNQIMFAAQQLTLSDSAVMSEFAEEIQKYECIELPNGEYVNWSGLIDYLRSIGKIQDGSNTSDEVIEITEDEDLLF